VNLLFVSQVLFSIPLARIRSFGAGFPSKASQFGQSIHPLVLSFLSRNAAVFSRPQCLCSSECEFASERLKPLRQATAKKVAFLETTEAARAFQAVVFANALFTTGS
jgi:hypothetical protein